MRCHPLCAVVCPQLAGATESRKRAPYHVGTFHPPQKGRKVGVGIFEIRPANRARMTGSAVP
jgi:hypothetical protein